MDFDLFFSSQRWRILEIIAKKPSSTTEISQKLNTTPSYVSQQLKLLEAADIIVKERTGFAEKGKPRTVFSLSREILHLNVLMKGLPIKKTIPLSDYHKIILRIWLLDNAELHYHIEKLYWRLEKDLKNIRSIFIDTSSIKPKVFVISDIKALKSKINSFSKEAGDILECFLVSGEDFKKISPEKMHHIYDSGSFT
ncbi:MAG TPA: transcriptional regulator [Candidatus Pacearchaeota archaeon]|nr:helix-turn-helix domain protein [archaeon BMS3Abin17]HDK42617.1 transcriptional regulator [Candidatus Pacearchaeota archaeon]HDZ60870.1 transcriptional regulator [Candidatus Pacearchaeota archaeon]